MTPQTILTRAQLRQLVEEYQTLRDWTIVRDFCNQAYGEGRVAKMDVETYGEYNDEGGTDYRVETLIPLSAGGELVHFDFSLLFWQGVLKSQNIAAEDADPDDAIYILREWYVPHGEVTSWVRWEDLPCDVHEGGNESYDLNQPPPVSFPVAFFN